ncbi:hypothetical protein KEM55_001859, partial [Ascosphaera atra]
SWLRTRTNSSSNKTRVMRMAQVRRMVAKDGIARRTRTRLMERRVQTKAGIPTMRTTRMRRNTAAKEAVRMRTTAPAQRRRSL